MPSAMNLNPPTPVKQELIREFLRLNGTQREIDTGSFLERFLFLSPPPLPQLSAKDAFDAIKLAYAPHLSEFQETYEELVNWEFTEEELVEINRFLISDLGSHFLEGRWRIGAYATTATEDLVDRIFHEIRSRLLEIQTVTLRAKAERPLSTHQRPS
jgi:hypothetical protein